MIIDICFALYGGMVIAVVVICGMYIEKKARKQERWKKMMAAPTADELIDSVHKMLNAIGPDTRTRSTLLVSSVWLQRLIEEKQEITAIRNSLLDQYLKAREILWWYEDEENHDISYYPTTGSLGAKAISKVINDKGGLARKCLIDLYGSTFEDIRTLRREKERGNDEDRRSN